MLELRRAPVSALADEIEEKLRELCAAHEVVVVQGDAENALPSLRDGDEVVTGEQNIRAYLEQFEKLIYNFSRRFTGDYCYLGDDGEMC